MAPVQLFTSANNVRLKRCGTATNALESVLQIVYIVHSCSEYLDKCTSPYKNVRYISNNPETCSHRFVVYNLRTFHCSRRIHYHHHHHHRRYHLALQPFVGFRLLSQVSPSSSILSCHLPVFYFQLF